MKKLHIFMLCFFGSFGMYSQEELEDETIPGMVTDRPAQTESPITVPKNLLQIESGSQLEGYENAEVITYNTTLLRYGLFKKIELRLGANYLKETYQTFEGEIGRTGFSPILIGGKYEIIDEKGWIPAIGLLAHAYLPFSVSDEYFRPEKVDFDFRFSMAHTLSEKSSLAYNAGMQWVGDHSNPFFIYTLVYSYAFTEKFAGFAELYGDFTSVSSAVNNWDIGATYLLTDNFQLDAYGGKGFGNGQELYLGAGFSIRIPN